MVPEHHEHHEHRGPASRSLIETVLTEESVTTMPSTTRMRAPLTPQWWGAFVAVPVVVGLAAAFLGRADVESTLQTRVERSVLQGSVSSVGVVVDGQDVKATVPTNASDATIETVRAAILGVDGVRSVKVQR